MDACLDFYVVLIKRFSGYDMINFFVCFAKTINSGKLLLINLLENASCTSFPKRMGKMLVFQNTLMVEATQMFLVHLVGV
jgi:hypothetical protein